MVEDDKGNLWLGSLDPGLLQFDRETGKVNLIRKGRGFAAIIVDQKGIVWWGNREGVLGRYESRIDRFNLNKLEHPITSIFTRLLSVRPASQASAMSAWVAHS